MSRIQFGIFFFFFEWIKTRATRDSLNYLRIPIFDRYLINRCWSCTFTIYVTKGCSTLRGFSLGYRLYGSTYTYTSIMSSYILKTTLCCNRLPIKATPRAIRISLGRQVRPDCVGGSSELLLLLVLVLVLLVQSCTSPRGASTRSRN